MLDKHNMERVEYLPGGHVPKVVGFCVRGIANEDAQGGSLEDLQVVSLNESECPTSDFAKVR